MRSLALLVLFALATDAWAQDEPIFPLFVAPDLDSTFIDLQRDNWSLRAFSSYRFHRFSLLDRPLDARIRYFPNNLSAVGVGLAYRFWLIDIGFGVNPVRENATKSFDLQTQVLLGSRHLLQFGLQTYQGFTGRGDFPTQFRDDLRVFYTGLDYAYYFKYRQLSMRSVFRGDFRQKRSALSPIVGGFLSADYLQADSSLVPGAGPNGGSSFVNSYIWILGVQGGFAGSLVLFRDLLLFGSVMPGVGLEWGRIEARGDRFRPDRGPAGKVNAQAAIMYMHPKFYTGVTGMAHAFFPIFNEDIRYRYQVAKLKILFGWRFQSKVPLLEKANRILEKQ